MNDISKRNIYLKNLLLILKGVAMGAANKVPGVSGGIIALIGGFHWGTSGPSPNNGVIDLTRLLGPN